MGRNAAVSRPQIAALARLSPVASELGLHMVGGTAIAVHLGHRRSADLDLFSRGPALDLELLRRRLLAELPDTQIVSIGEVALHAVVGSIPVDVVSYPYAPLVEPTAGPGGVPIAHLRDLVAMKLAAIAKRGIRRDFWDFHAIIESGVVSLADAFTGYTAKFGVAEPDLYPVLRALVYFEDADRESVWPRGLVASHWSRIKRDIAKWAPAMINSPSTTSR